MATSGSISLSEVSEHTAVLTKRRPRHWWANCRRRVYAGIHTVHGACPHCDHIQELDLAALVAAGQGDVPLIHLPLRCSACGRTGHKIIVSGQSYGYDRPRKGT